MANIPDEDLEAVIKKAGIGVRNANKLRKANKPQDAEEAKPKGHGSPHPDRTPLERF